MLEKQKKKNKKKKQKKTTENEIQVRVYDNIKGQNDKLFDFKYIRVHILSHTIIS